MRKPLVQGLLQSSGNPQQIAGKQTALRAGRFVVQVKAPESGAPSSRDSIVIAMVLTCCCAWLSQGHLRDSLAGGWECFPRLYVCTDTSSQVAAAWEQLSKITPASGGHPCPRVSQAPGKQRAGQGLQDAGSPALPCLGTCLLWGCRAHRLSPVRTAHCVPTGLASCKVPLPRAHLDAPGSMPRGPSRLSPGPCGVPVGTMSHPRGGGGGWRREGPGWSGSAGFPQPERSHPALPRRQCPCGSSLIPGPTPTM